MSYGFELDCLDLPDNAIDLVPGTWLAVEKA